MKNFKRAMFTFAAFAVLGLIALFVINWGNEFNPVLSLCVEYTKGFTQHTDVGGIGHGISLASIFAATKFHPKEDVPNEGGGGGADETMRKMADAAGVTVEDMQAMIDARAKKVDSELERQAPTPVTVPPIAPQPSVGHDFEAERSQKLRVVRYLNLQHALAVNNHEKARNLKDALREESTRFTPEILNGEYRDAERIIKASNLSGSHKARILYAIDTRMNEKGEKRHFDTMTDPDGGYLLAKPFLAELFVLFEEFGVARSVFRPIPMSGQTLDLKNIASKPTAWWVDECQLIPETCMQFGDDQLTNKKLGAIGTWCNEFEDDAAIAWLPTFQQLLAQAFTEKEDDAAFNGDGTSAFGGFTGVLHLPSANQYVLGAGKTSFTDLVYDDLVSITFSTPTGSAMGNQWFFNRTILANLLKLKDLQGRPLLFPDPNNPNFGSLLGYRYNLVEKMPTMSLSGANKPFVAFGNPMYYLMGMRKGFSIEFSRDAVIQKLVPNQPADQIAQEIAFNAFQQDGTAMKAIERIGFQSALDAVWTVVKTAAA